LHQGKFLCKKKKQVTMAAPSPMHSNKGGLDPTHFDESERIGLTTEQAEERYLQYGYNELPEVTVSLYWLFFVQFTGTMPYMLELACIIAIAVQDYTDFGIILAMLMANGFLGFHEQLKAAESLVSVSNNL
jgi:magnesium-transporting ATPase (P-type)